MKLRNLFFGFVALTTICYAKGQTCDFLDNSAVVVNATTGVITHKGITDKNSSLGLTLAYTQPLKLLELPNIKYINVTQDVDNSQLVFELTDEFLNLDQNEANTHGADYTITQSLSLDCGGPITLVFEIPITDTNGNDPAFAQESYEIVAALPLPPKFDLTALGDVIKATDIDFSNENITFTLEPSGNFDLTTKLDPEDPLGKTFIAEIKVSRYTWLPGDETFTLTAKDSGENSTIASTYFKIRIDQENSVPSKVTITFSQPSYTFEYSVDDNNIPSLGAPDNPIKFANPLEGDVLVHLNSDYFAAHYERGNVIIESTGTALDNASKDVLSLVLTATPANDPAVTANTVILINLPADVVDLPKFTSPFYIFTYVVRDDKDAVAPNGQISVTEGAIVLIIPEQDHGDHFVVAHQGNGIWQITVKTDLEPDILDDGGQIVLKVEATLTDAGTETTHTDYSALVINLPVPNFVQIPKFSKQFYSATYIGDGNSTDTVTVNDGQIEIIDADDSVVVELVDEYAENFQLDENYELSVSTPLSADILKDNFEIVLTLQATLEGADSGFSTIVVNLPKPSLDAAPAFKKPWYRAEYKIADDGGTDTAEFVGDHISLIDGIEATVHVTIEDSPLSTHFEIVSEADDNFRIDVVSNLVGDDLKEIDIVLTLIATADESNEKSSGTLVITLPTQISINSPKYSSLLYEATYEIVNNVSSVRLKDDQTISVTDGVNNVSVLSPYDVNFGLILNLVDNIYELSVKKVLGDDVLTDNIEIFVYLDAAADVESVPHGTAIVAIKLPEKLSNVISTFSEVHYQADYNTSSDPHTVSLRSPIQITSQQSTVVVIGNFKENLKPTLNGDTWNIIVQQPLDGAILNNETEIIVTLEALSGDNNIGQATLIISLPAKKEGDKGCKNKDDGDNITFIVVIAVLAVLVVGALVGSLFFYCTKMRNR